MGMKTCSRCGEVKDLHFFYKRYNSKDGYKGVCKDCSNSDNKKYYKTKRGLITKIYGQQIKSSKIRGHDPPRYDKHDLIKWCLSQNLFYGLYDKWIESGCDKKNIPSIDRIDDSIGYSFENIQLMTWVENNSKIHDMVRGGLFSYKHKPHKPVVQLNKDGSFVAEYISVNEAGRSGVADYRNISLVCRGFGETSGGYKWVFKENYHDIYTS